MTVMNPTMPNNDDKNDDRNDDKIVFTDRQIEIIEGWSNTSSIGLLSKQLGIQESTVQTHLRRLRARLKVQRTVDVYLYLLRNNHLNNSCRSDQTTEYNTNP